MKTILGIDLITGEKIVVTDRVRQSGMYILGIPGQGKSLLIGNLIYQDLEKDYAVILMDPHDDLLDHVIAQMPEKCLEKTYLLDMNAPAAAPIFMIICRNSIRATITPHDH